MTRFENLADRKTREARAAQLPPLQTLDTGATEGLQPIGNAWTREKFDGDFFLSPVPGEVPATSLVFVQSADGNTGARNPSVLGGGKSDKHLIYEGLSRVAADGVLAGADTVRGTGVVFSVWEDHLVDLRASLNLPRHPIQIVVTRGALTIENTLLLNVPEVAAIVISTADGIARMRKDLLHRPWVTPIAMDTHTDLRGAFRTLRSMGIRRISAVGGRTIARALTEAGLIQDLYLTTSPLRGGEPDTPLYAEPVRGRMVVKKRGTGADTGGTFEHLVI